ncbi:MAG TPA: hypothetical protein VK163_15425 [Opitutaceae bacterium]|nr:hypothetical protein [Opitutaceae bacterium]
MANWEYKVISSGKHGMATMAALEQHLNELGQQQWEIINWHTAPDNPLLFTGLARRPILRDWKPDEMPAAQEAARIERVTEEAKEREAWRETLKEELEFLTDKEEDVSDPEADREDLLDLLRPQMKRSQRGPGSVGSVAFLARKLEQDENDLLGALGEIGLAVQDDPLVAPPALQHDDEYFWLNKNQRGEIWLNCGPKPPSAKPAPRAERQRPEPRAEEPAPQDEIPVAPAAGEAIAAEAARAESGETVAPEREPRREQPRREQPRHEQQQQRREPQPPRENGQPAPLPEGETLLAKLRPMMRRNRRGRGWSGSTSYLSRALRHQEPELMEAFAKLGITLTEDPQAKPVFVELNGFLYWLNRGQGGQIWINAREKRAGEQPGAADEGEGTETAPSAAPEHADSAVPAAPAAQVSAEPAPVALEPVGETPAAEPVAEATLAAETESATPAPSDDNSVFARIRPHFTKNKRSASFSAAPGAVAESLGVSQADLVEALVKAGLEVPESEDSKPVFAEHAGEIFWFNRNAKDELWLNAKAKPARKSGGGRSSGRSRKSGE